MAQTPRPLRRSRMAPGRPARQSVQSTATAARHIRLLRTLNHVLNTIAGTPDIEREIQSLAWEIASRFQFTTVAIGIVEGDDLVFRSVASRDMPLDFSNPVSRGICGRVVSSGLGELVSNVRPRRSRLHRGRWSGRARDLCSDPCRWKRLGRPQHRGRR